MADTNTSHYNFTLVEVGASRDTWGAKTNSNMTSIDTNIWSVQGQVTSNGTAINSLQSQINSLQTQINNNLTTVRNEYKAWLPIGTIVLWTYGGGVPAGWAICDGRTVTRTDGGGSLTTPNMMGRFVLADPNPGVTGGNYTASAATDSQGYHSHGGVTGGHAITIAEMPAHTHTGAINGMTGTQSTGGNAAHTPRGETASTGGGAAHTHAIGGDGGHAHNVTITVVPNYFTAIYIMRY